MTTTGTTGGGFQSTVGSPGGYAFAYSSDGTGCTSLATATIDMTAVCVTGMTGIASTATPYVCNGAGFGINVGQAMGATVPGTCSVLATSTGITYALSNFPTIPGGGLRIEVVTGTAAASATNSYCAPITAATGTIPWTSLELTCYNTPAGTPLAGPPAQLQQVEISIDDGTAATAFNFCIDSISF
jgi:hypothetical protein